MNKDLIKSPDLLFAIFPFLIIASIYIYFISSFFVLGYWPTPYHPDPKTDILASKIGILLNITWFVFYSAPLSVIIYLALLPYRLFYYREKYLVKKMMFYSSCWIVTIAWVKFDPFSIIEWFFD